MRVQRGLSAGLIGATALCLTSCGNGDEAPVPVDAAALEIAAQLGAGIDPAFHAGEVEMKIPADLPLENTDVPIVIYTGLTGQTETRLAMNAFVDLRSVQARLPELASGVLHETCKHEIALDLVDVAADGELVRARGMVRAKLYSCNRRDPENEKQGMRWLTQDVDVVATAKATVDSPCIRFDLVELELDPHGLLGGIANLFGLTTLARSVILEKAETFFAETPVCPKLPEGLNALAPELTDGGVREIGESGIGAVLSGSVDTSASTMIGLLALVEERNILEGDK